MLCQALLRVILSSEKNQYLLVIENENSSIIDDLKSTNTNSSMLLDNIHVDPKLFNFFEISFISSVVTKCIDYYYKSFGNKPQVLFRREESYDEIIKMFFLTFGNSMFHSIYVYINPFLSGVLEFKEEQLFTLIDIILENLITQMPLILRILLKLIHDKIKMIYLVDTYEPLLVVVFFNFLFNPKVQIYNNFNVNNEVLRDISMIIYKACFNGNFNTFEKLSKFNLSLAEVNKKLLLCMECVVEKVNQLDEKELFRELMEQLYSTGIIHPEWMFYVDCDFLMRVLNDFKLIKIRSNTKVSSDSGDSRESFYVKFDKEKASETIKELSGFDSE